MPTTVPRPPALIAQETPAWCFAAAELMARNYYGLATPTQYAIARASLVALVDAQDQVITALWSSAIDYDRDNHQDERDGANLDSAVVELIRNTYGTVNYDAINGYIARSYNPQDIRGDIDQGNILIIGNANHFFIVYGYDDTGDFTLLLRDPWPAGRGGAQQSIRHDDFMRWNFRLVIRFR